MDEHYVPRTQIPERLYRVQHDKSFTKDAEIGLVASDMTTFTEDSEEFATAVEYHINGSEEDNGSIFISAFASKTQAEDWMCRKWRSYGEGAQILEIETSRLGHGYVYRAGEVVQTLEVDVSYTTYEDLHNEYLILHIVPARAIIARRARMVTHGLENKDSAGDSSSDATMTARQSSGSIQRFQPSGQPGKKGQPALPKAIIQLQSQTEYVRSPRGSIC
ncbi:hypothetical protein VN97_g3844 [Penicillium thymicola]|uniref:DUF7587 domain-containing protein n=1 Tax=Penicillium thymicola TaxID=293382 RepID=A0AAI9X9W6_PENTH|nr:hypothetical protein VN97_g3844 [Penicillium thymicola]